MTRVVTAVLAASFLASMASAEDAKVNVPLTGKSVSSETVCASQCSSQCSQGCPIEAAMAKLPTMTYLVGKEATCCSKSAAELAKKSETPIRFVVAKQTYESEGKAMDALANATEVFVSEFTKTKHCEVSGSYSVAGKEVCCEVMAGQRAELAKKAMKKVEMTYLVGDKECLCPNEAASLAKETGKDKLFVIAGQTTCCNIDARIKLARAKYKAAVEALAKADAPKETAEES